MTDIDDDIQVWIRHGRIGTGRGYQEEVERAKRIEAERNERVVPCEACQSEGRVLTNDGGPDDVDHGACPHCEGTGGEIIETQPVELADFECENCLGMPEHGCYCKALGAVGPGGPIPE